MPLEVAGMWRMIGASQTKRDVKGQGRAGGGGREKGRNEDNGREKGQRYFEWLGYMKRLPLYMQKASGKPGAR